MVGRSVKVRMVLLIICCCLLTIVQGVMFKPCNNDIFVMDDVRYGQNYWLGSLNLQTLPNWPLVQLQLQLSSVATVTLKEPNGQVTAFPNNIFFFNYQVFSGLKFIKFTVQSQRNVAFPNIVQLQANGYDICTKPLQVQPDRVSQQPGRPPAKPPVKPPPKPPAKPSVKPSVKPPPKPKPVTNRDGVPGQKKPAKVTLPKCGIKKIKHQGLITNGYPSKEGDWPWHVALYHHDGVRNIQYKCGGTLIATDVVLTAAHCVTENSQSITPGRLIIKLGQHNRLIASRNTQEFRVFKVVPHGQFNVNDLKNDIAVLKLATAARFNNYIQPACLWPNNHVALEEVVNKHGLVIGWGLNEKDTLTDILTQGSMPVVSPTTCLESNRDFFGMVLSDKNFCAGFRNGTSVCNGDSGGGMFFQMGDAWYIRGIVSLSVARGDKDVCNPKQYVIFTDVAKYLSWIKDHMK